MLGTIKEKFNNWNKEWWNNAIDKLKNMIVYSNTNTECSPEVMILIQSLKNEKELWRYSKEDGYIMLRYWRSNGSKTSTRLLLKYKNGRYYFENRTFLTLTEFRLVEMYVQNVAIYAFERYKTSGRERVLTDLRETFVE